MTDASLKSSSRWFWVSLLILIAVLIRLLSLGLYPLMDTSEARYGEIVRLMVETNDWVIPYFDYGIPFLGKPPLFIWLSAVSFKLFGINEFAARSPSLICSLGILALVWKLAHFQMGKQQAKITVLFLITSATFLVLSGALLADPVMTLTITLILCSFWMGWHYQDKSMALRWQYLFFAGCGLAFLAKGLAAVVLAGGPIFLWCLPKARLITLWHTFPWIKGTVLAAAIALPWYISAEIRNPGLLEYMFIGEHFSRYLDSGWQGDEYGNAHVHMLGAIWGYLLAGGFPWTFVLLGVVITQLWKFWQTKPTLQLQEWDYFLLCWLLFLPLFFTFTANLIWTYTLPVMPALALIIARLFGERWPSHSGKLIALATLTPLLMIITTIVMMNDGGKKSQKYLVAGMMTHPAEQPGHLIYFMKRPFSARFYSQGQALLAFDEEEILDQLHKNRRDFLATRDGNINMLSDPLRERFEKVSEYRNWTLWVEKE
ncbi:glycosyltransferase family 39 protein [Endozoicomonas sp. SESOKO4]|uniref:ArnT family glycosyltransferase n=1 Tax=Endozoicomonas sp. SESOKO4 TaxID=2828745 RepID=UPI0021489589|nr:glycosyltransferase family 39 protein [Endozoicomonas sp. SESOKO4]